MGWAYRGAGMKYHGEFEWDPRKARANQRKHGVTFDDAAAVLGDDEGERFHIEEYDDAHSMGEDRHVTIGSHPAERRLVLWICWTRRFKDRIPVARIISARHVTAHEGKRYAEEISRR
jgi:uncharacterized DUF497 family protein